ncbi:general transcription factor 3C polypeptide 1 [Anopheles ziemanni]|uniref:general transcription factor 3C polypeptide 1 n=1 Tax=Anopheles coustani TaxID=139045 RepID=UPI0026583C7E|nr:general transcription factor 3C polypeptide 1 [Anopheles coustani]XP_058169813.1 general transcription factor 3C polypeptide 1 [Anopheles ziemanni]
MLPKASLSAIVKEEISLEGLEGSTLNTLWNRIAVRLGMTMPIPAKLMDTVWAKVLDNPELEYYLLLESRKTYVWFDRLANVDPETGVQLQPPEYPGHRFKYNPIEANGIRGSCEEYSTRTPMSREELRAISSQEAEERYGQKFVIVASQRLRESFLIHPNCTTDLTLVQYCMLEWIGRSRFNGETSHGKFSLLEVAGDSSALFYNRKALCNARLITRQNLSIRSEDASVMGIVMHLPRYYNEMKSKQLMIAQRVVTELKRRRDYIADYEEIKLMMLGRADAGKLFRTPEFQRYIKTDEQVPYRELYPDAPVSAWQSKRGEEKFVRIMRLIDPNADVQDREPDDAEQKDGFLASANKSALYVDMSLGRQALKTVAESGESGISQSELAAALEQDRLNARGIVKNMVKMKLVASQSEDKGRQRMAKYYIPGQRKPCTQYDKELSQFVSNQLEVIETQRQQQSSMEAENFFKESSKLMPDAHTLAENYSTMFNSCVPTDRNNDGKIVLPLDAFNSAGQDNIVTSVILSNKLSSMKVKPGISEAMKTKSVSVLMLRRCNFIVNLVKHERAIDPRTIFKRLATEERNRGMKYEACSRSVKRLIGQLAADRLVLIANITMKRDEREIKHVFVCDTKIMLDLAPLQSRVNMVKMRVALQSNPQADTRSQPATSVRENTGCLSKCLRMKLFHEFLFYLVYDHRPDATELPIGELKEIDLSGLEAHELTPVYSDTNDWKMFVPPIPVRYEPYGAGWVLLADVLVRMPLAIFCSIGAFTYYVPELEYYLDHPLRRYFLIKQLPDRIQERLFAKRRYIYSILVTVKLLCYAGLVQIGPQLAKVLDQTMVYVNRTTALLDTTSSRAGYIEIEDREYPMLEFRFLSLAQVKEYWKKLYEIATQTRINTRSTAIGREILVQQINTKPSMVEAVKVRTRQTAALNDCCKLPPGDKMGAAGMDTAMYMHLKSNWHKLITFAMPIDRHRLTQLRKSIVAKRVAGVAGTDKGKRLTLKKVIRPFSAPGGAPKGVVSTVTPAGGSKMRPKRRVIKPIKVLKRRPWFEGYDDVDKRALTAMSKLRVKWTVKEDQLLQACRVALLYLYGNRRAASCPVHSAVYRDILHWSFPASQSKTSRACQRRLTYMTARLRPHGDQIRTMLEECKLDPEITMRFGTDFLEKLQERYPEQDHFVLAIRIHFVQLVHMLRCRFFRKQNIGSASGLSSVTGPAVVTRRLPNSMSEFLRQYNVTDPNAPRVRLNYAADPTTPEELVRLKLTIVMHSAVVNRRSICDELLQQILERFSENTVNGAAELLRRFQIVSTTLKKNKNTKVIIKSSSLAGDKRIFHLSIGYQQQLLTAIPLERFVPIWEQYVALFGREQYTVEYYTCEDGGDAMALLLSELVASDRVELSIDEDTNYIEIRKDAAKGHSTEMLRKLHGDELTDPLHSDSTGEFSSTSEPSPKKSRHGKSTISSQMTVSKKRAHVARKRPSAKKGAGSHRTRSVHFSTDNKIVTFQYAMHPIEQLAKLPIEYFHFFCFMEQLKVADHRLLAQTFKIDEQIPASCSLPRCVVMYRQRADKDLIGRCLERVQGRTEQLDRIRQAGCLENGKISRQNRIDAAQFFDIREDNLLLFFGRYIGEYQVRAGLKHKRDFNRQQQLQGVARTAVNMADLIADCLAAEETSETEQLGGWLELYERTNTVASAVDANEAVDDADDDEEPDEIGEDCQKSDGALGAVSEKVFKLHNFYEVAAKTIHVLVRLPPDGGTDEWEMYGRWSVPRAFLPDGAKRRKGILVTAASDVVWPLADQLAPLMSEAMTLIGRNQYARAILEFIEEKTVLGATVKELAAAFPNHDQLEQQLRTMKNVKLLLRTGFRSVTYVHWRYADLWLMKTVVADELQSDDDGQLPPEDPVPGPSGEKRKGDTQDEERQLGYKKCKLEPGSMAADEQYETAENKELSNKHVQIAMAPWIQIDGTLDKRLLYRWLSTLLLYCVEHPCVPFSVLFTRFNIMSPFHLRQLMEMLQNYGCVSLHAMERKQPATLFSVPQPSRIVVATEFSPEEQTFIEPSPNALSTLSLCIGESRKYTQDLYDPVRKLRRTAIGRPPRKPDEIAADIPVETSATT